MSARQASLVTHTHPDQTRDAVVAALAAARTAGFELVVTEHEAVKHGGALADCRRVERMPDHPDLCLALGGDGTILQALRRYVDTGVPVFGINYGTIGFLAAVERDRFEEGLERAFAGDFETLELPGLVTKLDIERPVALNDISLIRKPHGRVAELSYSIGGREIGHVRCDGLVAATPVGSTGYNLANQGPVLAWGVEGYVVSFIAPHTLTARPLVVAPGDVLHVSNERGREAVDVAFDGLHVAELASGDELVIAFRDGAASLAQLPGASFYERMRDKFGRLAG
ncbi:MAG TPA: NAD(+)/NADH kinase [Solirubrobacterales bacterium]